MIKTLFDKQPEEPVFIAAENSKSEFEKAKINLDNFTEYLEKNPSHPLDAFMEVSQSINHAFGYLCNQLSETELSIKNTTITSNEFTQKITADNSTLEELKIKNAFFEDKLKETNNSIEILKKELDQLESIYMKKKNIRKASQPILFEFEDVLSNYNEISNRIKLTNSELEILNKNNDILQADLIKNRNEFSKIKNDHDSEIKNIISEIKYLDKKSTELEKPCFPKTKKVVKSVRKSMPPASTFVINDTFKCSQSELSFLIEMIESINSENQKLLFDINSKITDIQLTREENENLRSIVRDISEK